MLTVQPNHGNGNRPSIVRSAKLPFKYGKNAPQPETGRHASPSRSRGPRALSMVVLMVLMSMGPLLDARGLRPR